MRFRHNPKRASEVYEERWWRSYEQHYGVSAIEADMIRRFWREMGRHLYYIFRLTAA